MRYNFSKRKNVLALPNLSSLQLDSYVWLKTHGITEILEELGTIEDYTGRNWVLIFSHPSLAKPNLSESEALRTGRTFDAPWYLEATLRNTVEKKEKKQTIYM